MISDPIHRSEGAETKSFHSFERSAFFNLSRGKWRTVSDRAAAYQAKACSARTAIIPAGTDPFEPSAPLVRVSFSRSPYRFSPVPTGVEIFWSRPLVRKFTSFLPNLQHHGFTVGVAIWSARRDPYS